MRVTTERVEMMKKYVIIGAGGRALYMFARPLAKELTAFAQLVGICDINPHRAKIVSDECGGHIPTFTDFDEMIEQCDPDTVIVSTTDSVHHEYIIRALEAGCDVISEKPLTIDGDKCRAILEAEKRTGKRVTVTFNCRFIPYVAKIKELLAAGTIGEVKSIHLEWFLDTTHGADYFRRWHGQLEHSGGLLIHKSTHHFDMVNWWLDDEPHALYAFGDTLFYGSKREQRGERCYTCPHQNTCEFYYDITDNDFTKKFYFEAEHHDGYLRDQCVFGDRIDICDTMSVNVNYTKGAYLSYTLTAYNPMEGWKATFVGSEGRMEAESFQSHPHQRNQHEQIHIYNHSGDWTTVRVPKESGEHGGGDQRLRRMIFVGDLDDPLGQQADSRAGAMSMLIGAGSNLSIAEKRPIVISELL